MTLQGLKTRHDQLKQLDKVRLKTFGSASHRYKFNPCLSEIEIAAFEHTHGVSLPPDYRSFLLHIGDGGSGPAYGLFPLSDWNYDLEDPDKDFLSTDFPYAEKWNRPHTFDTENEDYHDTEEFQKWEEEYFSNEHITGTIRICHYGCAIYYLLVVTGKETGHIWVDDRASDGGIYPATSAFGEQRLTFTNWYSEWLTRSIQALEKAP